jgi:hypothetical protein
MVERDGQYWWPPGNPLNYVRPKGVPVKPQGSIPVIVRLEWPENDEWVPGRAIRWSSGCVMVLCHPPGAPSQTDELTVWLRARDVYTSVPRRPKPASPLWGPKSGVANLRGERAATDADQSR